MIKHFAWIAEANHVDVLVVGSELVSTEEQGRRSGRRTINTVREIFHGRLTYSSQLGPLHVGAVLGSARLIGMNSYWKIRRSKTTTPTMRRRDR